MRLAGMMRLAEIDQQKVGKELMKLSIGDLANKVSKLYFLQIGNIDQDILDFINLLPTPSKITPATTEYDSGWIFKNNESLDDLYKTIDEQFDWVLYPDADDILPQNIAELIEEADAKNAQVLRVYFIECFGSVEDIIEVTSGYPIGPHFKAVKYNPHITFVGSDGFNEPKGPLVRHETDACVRHLRYASAEGVQKRKDMNYFQEYFLQNLSTIKFVEGKPFNYYTK
jgi:hypothetical protein